MTDTPADPWADKARQAYEAEQGEAQSRDQAAWDLNVRQGLASAEQTEAHARHAHALAEKEHARAHLMGSVSGAIWCLVYLGVIYGLVQLISAVVGLFR